MEPFFKGEAGESQQLRPFDSQPVDNALARLSEAFETLQIVSKFGIWIFENVLKLFQATVSIFRPPIFLFVRRKSQFLVFLVPNFGNLEGKAPRFKAPFKHEIQDLAILGLSGRNNNRCFLCARKVLPDGYSAHVAHPERYSELPFKATELFSAKMKPVSQPTVQVGHRSGICTSFGAYMISECVLLYLAVVSPNIILMSTSTSHVRVRRSPPMRTY